MQVKSYEDAEKKRRKRGKGIPPSPGLTLYTDVLTRAAQRHSILYDLWPNQAALDAATKNPAVNPFTDERYRNAATAKAARISEIYLAIGDIENPPARGLERYMGKVTWVRTFVRIPSCRRSLKYLRAIK